MNDIESFRPGFEAWCETAKYSRQRSVRNTRSDYMWERTEGAWQGWLAAKADTVVVTEEQSSALRVRSYAVGDSRVTIEWRDAGTWAVCESGCCLADDGEWETEPLPSSRTDDFIARCRFGLPRATQLAVDYVAALNGEGK